VEEIIVLTFQLACDIKADVFVGITRSIKRCIQEVRIIALKEYT